MSRYTGTLLTLLTKTEIIVLTIQTEINHGTVYISVYSTAKQNKTY